MNAPLIARILGALFLVVGVLALIPVPFLGGAPAFDAPVVTLDIGNRMLFGIFPVNLAHDVLHIVLGVSGLLAGARFASAVGYCRVVAVLYLLLVVFGAIPLTDTLLGVAPIYGYDLLLHLLAALLAAYGGFARGSVAPEHPQAASGS